MKIIKSKKESFIDMSSYLYDKCNVPSLLKYHKGNITQAPLEALLTYYTAQSIVVLTGMLISPNTNLITALRYIIIPLIIGVVVCTLFLIVASYSITKKLYFTLKQNENESGIKLYRNIEKDLKRTFRNCQITGMIAYLLVAVCTSFYYSTSRYFTNPTLGILVCSGIGLLSGVIWNTLGYIGNRLIDWRKIVKSLSSFKFNNIEDIKKEKFRYFVSHIIINSSMVLILLIIQCISLAFNVNIKFDDNLIIVLIPLTIGIISLYCRLVYVQYYFKEDEKSVYLSINDLFKSEDTESSAG